MFFWKSEGFVFTFFCRTNHATFALTHLNIIHVSPPLVENQLRQPLLWYATDFCSDRMAASSAPLRCADFSRPREFVFWLFLFCVRTVNTTVCWHHLLFQFSNFEFPNLAIYLDEANWQIQIIIYHFRQIKENM
jgi:hypothetical protein